MSRYILTEQAAQDLNDIWEHIAGQSIDQADAVLREIRDALELLASMPGAGHRRSDVRNKRYRFWRANRFIIAYFRDTRPLQIIRIVGGHRDFRRIFFK
jgi:plasmid stabilization system protein ParE